MAQSFILFDVPNASFIRVYGINDRGEVAGYFSDSQSHKGRSFLWGPNALGTGVGLLPPGTSGNLTVFDVPNTSYTQAQGINSSGDIVGLIQDGFGEHGFVRHQNGDYTVFDAPNAKATSAQSINSRGYVTGTFSDSTQGAKARAFVWDQNAVWSAVSLLPPGTTSDFVVFDAPNASATFPQSINILGEVAGWFYDVNTGARMHGFFRDRQGNITVFDAPNASNTQVLCMNDSGEVVGYVSGPSLDGGFLRHQSGNITVFDGPNANHTEADSINDRGDVAGIFLEPGYNLTRGYVRSRQGDFTAFDIPNASGLFVQGINDRGDVAGTLTDSSQGNKWRGFVLSIEAPGRSRVPELK